MKIASTAKPASIAPVAPAQNPLDELPVLLASLGALGKKIAPFVEQMNAIKAQIAQTVLEHGTGKGETKIITVDDIEMKVSPKTTYTISQDEFRQMVDEFPEDRQDVAFAVVRWKSELDKRRYNSLGDVDKGIVDKYVTSKEGKPYLKIKYPGQDDGDEG